MNNQIQARITKILLVAITILLPMASQTLASQVMIDTPEFNIFYNGSIRGDLGKMTGGVQARTVTLLNEKRKDYENLISLCAGDIIGPSATSNVDGGKTVINVMNL